MEPCDVMVVTAHPDDAEFGVAGTVARWTQEGKAVVYVLCTSGDKGTSDPNLEPAELAHIREGEQRAAAQVVGVREVVFLGYPDGGVEDTKEFRKELVRLLRLYRPQTVVTFDPYRRYQWHRDHRMVGQVTMDAIFPYARDRLHFPELATQGLQPHKVREVLLVTTDDVNFRSDITATFDLKIKALFCHQSQFKERSQEQLVGTVRERARQNAQGESFELAEAFHRLEMSR